MEKLKTSMVVIFSRLLLLFVVGGFIALFHMANQQKEKEEAKEKATAVGHE